MAEKRNFFFRYKLHHVLFWLVYGGFWIAVSWDDRAYPWQVVVLNFFYLLSHISASYISIYILLPRFLYRRRYLMFLLASSANLLVATGVVVLGFVICFYPYPKAWASVWRWPVMFQAAFLSTFFTVLLLTIVKIAQQRIQAESRERALEKEKMRTELDYLKAQVNPHFLFNAINNIYFLMQKDTSLAADSLLRFSDMLRYQLYECSADLVSLQSEVDYIRNYVSLKKLGLNQGTEVSLDLEGDIKGKTIAPLLLITFIENAFKHLGQSNDSPAFIRMRIASKEKELEMEVSNSFAARKTTDTGGIGLTNVRRLLELLYPKRYHLHTQASDGVYSVNLKIRLYDEDAVPGGGR